MNEDLSFLEKFPKERNGMYIVYEIYTFDNLFRLLLKAGLDYEEAYYFILFNCSLNAVVFQERLHNNAYEKLSAEDALPPCCAARKARLIYDMLSLVSEPS